MKKQIWSIVHLMDGNGNVFKLDEFNNTYNCSIWNYIKMTQNISSVLIQFIKNNLENTPKYLIAPKLQNININYVDFLRKRCINTFLR